MVSCNFSPNESWDDAWIGFKLLFQPWRWINGKESAIIKKIILKKLINTNNQFSISFFLSGRSALYHLLKVLDLKPGDEVLVQAFTCEAVVLPIIALNLKPVYIDIERQSFSMNPIDLEKKLSKRSKVLILQHSFGITPIYIKKILAIVKQRNLVLIEDIAHSIKKLKIKNQKSKINKHFFLLSFGRSKSISSVFGGAVVGNHKKIMEKLEDSTLKQPSYSFIFKCLLYKPIVMIIKTAYNIYWGKILHKMANFLNLLIPEISKKEKSGDFDQALNKNYPNALAILLLHQLKKFNKINQNRQKIVNFYQKHFKNMFQVTRSTLCFNQPLIRYPLLVKNRDLVMETMAKKSIFLGNWYTQPVAPEDVNLERVGYRKGSCPIAEKTCQEIINLPTNVDLNNAKKIIQTLNDVLNEEISKVQI